MHYPIEVMLVRVRWYAAYPLSLRHVEEMMAERGMFVDHAKRDHAAARAFFERAIDLHGVPEKITIDKSGANTAAITSILGFKTFRCARILLAGIEVMHMIRKG